MRNIKKLAITLCATLAFGASVAGVATINPFYANAETENAEVVTETVVVGNFSESNHGAKLWGGKGTVAHNTDPAYIHGNENGSLKVTPTATGGTYLEFTPVTKDLTNYEKLTCYVYNPNDYAVKFDFAFVGGKVCASKEWTELTINLDDHFDENNISTLGTTSGEKFTRDNITGLCFYNYGSNLALNDSVYFSNLYAYNGECELVSFKMIEGGSIRTDDPVGIRFATEISAEDLAKLPANAEFGTIIYPTAGLTDTTIPELYEAKDEGLVYIKKNVWASTGDYASTDTFNRYYSVLIGEDINTGLDKSLWDKQLTAMSYVTYTDEETGITYKTWADNAQSRSVVYVAAAAEAAGKGTEFFDTIFTEAVGTLTLDSYLTEMKVGEKQTLTTNAKDDMGATLPVVWETSDATIATVENGVVTAVGAGTVEITAKLGNLEATATITVNLVNTILFDMANEADADNVYLPQWAWVFATAFDDTVKFNNGNGSLKVTWTTMASDTNVAWLSFKNPAITDISAYDYVTFDVYNPTSKTGSIVLNGADNSTAKVTSQGVTTFRYSIADLFNGVAKYKDTSTETAINKTNVSGFTIKFWKYDWNNQTSGTAFGLGDSIWISPIRLEKAGETIDSTVTVNDKTVLFAAFSQKNWVQHCSVSSNNFITTQYSTTFAYSTDYAYGTEAGSLKVTAGNTNGEMGVVVKNPMIRDISNYQYIVFRVYNPTDTDVSAGFWWCGDTKCKAGQWTEIKFDVKAYYAANKTMSADSGSVSLSNAHSIVFRIMGATKGQSYYISNVYVTNE